MKVKKIPQRMCLGCQVMKPKKELIRVAKNTEGIIKVDLTGKAPGRGAYICKELECLEKAIKSKRFERAFETKISEEIFLRLREELANGK
jgi:predicted RNA-binding protein YlxR (DUF448 family)